MKAALGDPDIPHDVIVGGMIDKAVPNINWHRPSWGYGTFVNLRHPDPVNNEQAVFDPAGNFSLTIGNNTHKMYVDRNGNLEYEVFFKEPPPENVIWFELKHSDDLEFIKQEPTAEQLTDPLLTFFPEAIGSYAIYHKTARNTMIHKAGRFGDIKRPSVSDALGSSWPCEIDIIGNQLKITIPQVAIDSAVYPLCLDPIIGYDSAGTGGTASTDGYSIYWETGQASINGTVTSFNAYTTVGGTGIKLSLANTSNTGPTYYCDGQTVVSQVEGVTVAQPGVTTIVPGDGGVVVLNNYYRVGIALDPYASIIKFDAGPTGFSRERTQVNNNYALKFISPVPSPTHKRSDPNIRLSMWAVIEAEGPVLNILNYEHASMRGTARGTARGAA